MSTIRANGSWLPVHSRFMSSLVPQRDTAREIISDKPVFDRNRGQADCSSFHWCEKRLWSKECLGGKSPKVNHDDPAKLCRNRGRGLAADIIKTACQIE